jgi:hypothetical protein
VATPTSGALLRGPSCSGVVRAATVSSRSNPIGPGRLRRPRARRPSPCGRATAALTSWPSLSRGAFMPRRRRCATLLAWRFLAASTHSWARRQWERPGPFRIGPTLGAERGPGAGTRARAAGRAACTSGRIPSPLTRMGAGSASIAFSSPARVPAVSRYVPLHAWAQSRHSATTRMSCGGLTVSTGAGSADATP